MIKATEGIAWPHDTSVKSAPDWYADCFRNALRRVAVLLNQVSPYSTCRGTKLSCTEAQLAALFGTRDWDQELIQFNIAKPDQYANSDEYSAENFFYSDVDFPSRGNHRVAKFLVPQTFLDWSFRRLHRPAGSAQELDLAEFPQGPDSPSFVQHCAANYLVKNFWHNYVHRAIQGISSANYHQFRGPAREDSDFEADHLANLFFARSYGFPLRTSGQVTDAVRERMEALFRRNRCNLVFAERAQHRASDRASMSAEERWAELEWRFCRGVANGISAAFVCNGLATSSVRIFLNGEIRSSGSGTTRKVWRTGEVIVEVGSRRFATDLPAYIPYDELRAEVGGRTIAAEREASMRKRRDRRIREIITVVVADYKKLIRTDPAFRKSNKIAVAALGHRLAIPL